MNHILLLEPNREHVPQLVFLLKLADIECTPARTVEEMLNWLSAAQLMAIHFDLLLLNSLPEIGPEKVLLDNILRATAIPVVYVQREGYCQPQFPGDDIVTCSSENLLICLRECLAVDIHQPGNIDISCEDLQTDQEMVAER